MATVLQFPGRHAPGPARQEASAPVLGEFAALGIASEVDTLASYALEASNRRLGEALGFRGRDLYGGSFLLSIEARHESEYLPEAMWCCRVLQHIDGQDQVVATLGLNLHQEGRRTICSVTHISALEPSVSGMESNWTQQVLRTLLDDKVLRERIDEFRGVSADMHPGRFHFGRRDEAQLRRVYDQTFMACGMNPVCDREGRVLYYSTG